MKWSKRISPTSVICLSCGLDIARKPYSLCESQNHAQYYVRRRKKNNEYRKKRRATEPYYGSGFNKETWNTYTREQYRKKKRELLERLGDKCVVCGFSDFRALVIDHISGNGTKERKLYGWQYLKMLHRSSIGDLKKNYQCLCANCNTIKEFERRWKK